MVIWHAKHYDTLRKTRIEYFSHVGERAAQADESINAQLFGGGNPSDYLIDFGIVISSGARFSRLVK